MSHRFSCLAFLLSFLFTGSFLIAQQRYPERSIRTSAEILLGMQKLNTVGSVLYIAAHPDDENTRMLSWLANERKVRTGYLSLTRGDGGQNLIGNEKGEELGLIRSQELLEARRRDGGEQFFTRARDFGYSKNPEETFNIWGKEQILADVVWVIRKFQPDVIITRFPTTGEGGHGHHTASAILANEAFTLAADPKAFPEQLRYVGTWQAKRVLWNSFSWNRKSGEVFPGEIAVHTGGFNALLGKSYGEIAAEARSMHRCQGFGTKLVRGEVTEYVKNVMGDSITADVLEEVNTSWGRLKGGEKIGQQLKAVIEKFDPDKPELSIAGLLAIRKLISNLPESTYRTVKLMETEELILACAGVFADAYTAVSAISPGQKVEITFEIINRSNAAIVLDKLEIAQLKDSLRNSTLENNKLLTWKSAVSLPEQYPVSQPLWLTNPSRDGVYPPADPLKVDQPENDASLRAVFRLDVAGEKINFVRNVWFKEIDPSVGEMYQPLVVSPPVVFELPKLAFITANGKPATLRFTLKNINTNRCTVYLKTPAGWKANWVSKAITFLSPGEVREMEVLLTPLAAGQEPGQLGFEVSTETGSYSYQRRDIQYPHIKTQTWFPQAAVTLQNINITNSPAAIGYIPGPGDDVAASLRMLGYQVTELSNDQLANSDLGRFKAVIAGIRVYNTNDMMGLHHARLMNYVKNCGNLIVQYNTNNFIGSVNVPIGPADFTIGRDRVTVEDAPVTILKPDLEVLNKPNKITPADFGHWVQERGLYFATKWDGSYTPLFEITDPDDFPMQGSTLMQQYGSGNFFYTGLSFFRQLPAGVPGAYRLLVNMIEADGRKEP